MVNSEIVIIDCNSRWASACALMVGRWWFFPRLSSPVRRSHSPSECFLSHRPVTSGWEWWTSRRPSSDQSFPEVWSNKLASFNWNSFMLVLSTFVNFRCFITAAGAGRHINNNNNGTVPNKNSKDFSQYEPIFKQVSEDKRTVTAFELQDMLEACLPNGKLRCTWPQKATIMRVCI